jgi:hypothetical protein
MPIKLSDVQWKSSISTMWRQNIILLVAAFLTTTYGMKRKYVYPFGSTLKPEVHLSNTSSIRKYSHRVTILAHSLVFFIYFEKYEVCNLITEELWQCVLYTVRHTKSFVYFLQKIKRFRIFYWCSEDRRLLINMETWKFKFVSLSQKVRSLFRSKLAHKHI